MVGFAYEGIGRRGWVDVEELDEFALNDIEDLGRAA
jgi:hypothetical protein